MKEFELIMKHHAELYPLMTPQDCIKLLYQNEYGPEHAVGNPEQSLLRLKQELEETEADESAELYIPVGNGLCRLQLQKAKLLYSPEEINEWFVSSANGSRGSMASFMKKLKTFSKNWQEYGFSFSEEELNEFLGKYRSEAYPIVHHSKIYRENYHPHYRVMYLNRWEMHDAEVVIKAID